MEYFQEQLSPTTLDIECSYFYDEVGVAPELAYTYSMPLSSEYILPPGKYRVIDGELCRILPGYPPHL